MLLVPLLYPPLSERALQRLLLSPLFLQARDQTLHLDREDAAAGGGLAGWVRGGGGGGGGGGRSFLLLLHLLLRHNPRQLRDVAAGARGGVGRSCAQPPFCGRPGHPREKLLKIHLPSPSSSISLSTRVQEQLEISYVFYFAPDRHIDLLPATASFRGAHGGAHDVCCAALTGDSSAGQPQSPLPLLLSPLLC